MTKESRIQARIVNGLNDIPGCKAIVIHGSPFIERGTPDITGSFRGKSFWIETKQPGEQPEPLQTFRLQQWADAGARSGVVENVEDAYKVLGVLP